MLVTAARAAPPPPPPPPDPNEPAPVSKTGRYSRYELETIRSVEESLGSKLDAVPHGKRVESIEYVALDVIERRDPLPLFLNAVHVTTKDYVLAREMLFRVGDPYVQVMVDETARNLRALPPLSLVLIVPLRGSKEDTVRVAVITKDIWSLRISWDVLVTPGGLERLLMLPGEINLAGTHQTAQARFFYQPESITLGGRYYVPRLFGSRIAASADANVIVNKGSGNPEGSWASAGIGQPLFSTRTEWAWGVSAGYRHEITRRYVNAAQSAFTSSRVPGASMPFRYRTQTASAEAYAVRSFGWARKFDITAGFEYVQRLYTIFDAPTSDPALVAEFQRTRVPLSDTRSGPYLQLRAYSTDFTRLLDFDTLGLQEDYRTGYDAYLRVQPVATAFGASRTYLSTSGGAQYTVPLGDVLVRAQVEGLVDLRTDQIPDASITTVLHIASPLTPFGRLVFDGRYLDRIRNYLNRTSSLGGESRLRGFPSAYFVGEDVVVGNLEFRTRPVQIASIQLAGAAFYDAAKVTSPGTPENVYQSLGVGFRILFPQLDRTVFRGDLGFPVAPEGLPPGVGPVSFFATFDQAFQTPTL